MTIYSMNFDEFKKHLGQIILNLWWLQKYHMQNNITKKLYKSERQSIFICNVIKPSEQCFFVSIHLETMHVTFSNIRWAMCPSFCPESNMSDIDLQREFLFVYKQCTHSLVCSSNYGQPCQFSMAIHGSGVMGHADYQSVAITNPQNCFLITQRGTNKQFQKSHFYVNLHKLMTDLELYTGWF